MTETTEVLSAWSTGVSAPVGYSRDFDAAVGDRTDTAATSTGAFSSTAFLKGSVSGLGLGSGDGVVMTAPRTTSEPTASFGAPTDTAATSSSSDASVTALLKGILAFAGV